MNAFWWLDPVKPLDDAARHAAYQRHQQLTKPAGSLGQLEALIPELAAQQGVVCPQAGPAHITVFAADHGIATHGVSAYPQAVTAQMLLNYSRDGAAICVLAQLHKASMEVIDVGVIDQPGLPFSELSGVWVRKIAQGTAPLHLAPAMSMEQCLRALDEGRLAAQRAQHQGARFLVAGEMGIGNTTSAAAMAAAVLQRSVTELTGRGTGVDDVTFLHKQQLIQQALQLHREAIGSGDVLGIMRCLGGFEIIAMVGAGLACAQLGMTWLVDGFTAGVAALLAVQLNPAARGWMVFGHQSAEQGHHLVLEALQAQPLLKLNMRLGEGSGAAMSLSLLEQLCALHARMATFEQAGVSDKSDPSA